MDFLPDNYEAPAGNSNYLKFQDGETRFRILSKPVIGWLDWKDKKPLRFPMDKKPTAPIDPAKPIKHFWAMVVWNYATSSVQILEITQTTIHQAIQTLSKDADWGAPFAYDLKVIKSGKDMDTKYAINPAPKKSLPEAAFNAAREKKICLAELFTGGDPFNSTATPTEIEIDPFQ